MLNERSGWGDCVEMNGWDVGMWGVFYFFYLKKKIVHGGGIDLDGFFLQHCTKSLERCIFSLDALFLL